MAVVKTQGSDTKLVGQMQPYYEARSLSRRQLASRSVPPLVTQIADGENGGVMMNEFPPKYFEVIRECSGPPTPIMNATQYLEQLFAAGIRPDDLPASQPVSQHRIWQRMAPGDGTGRLADVISQLRCEDNRFHVDGGSWTNDISWVRGYDQVLVPMERASSLFHHQILARGVPIDDFRHRNALFHLLTAKTSCYRYWGQGIWTDYGAELSRRVAGIVTGDPDRLRKRPADSFGRHASGASAAGTRRSPDAPIQVSRRSCASCGVPSGVTPAHAGAAPTVPSCPGTVRSHSAGV